MLLTLIWLVSVRSALAAEGVHTGEVRGPSRALETSFVPEEFHFVWDRPSIKEFFPGEGERLRLERKVVDALNNYVADSNAEESYSKPFFLYTAKEDVGDGVTYFLRFGVPSCVNQPRWLCQHKVCSMEATPDPEYSSQLTEDRPLIVQRHSCVPTLFCYECGGDSGSQCPEPVDMVEKYHGEKVSDLKKLQCPPASSVDVAPVCFLRYNEVIAVRTVEAMGCAEMSLQETPGPYDPHVCTTPTFSDYGKSCRCAQSLCNSPYGVKRHPISQNSIFHSMRELKEHLDHRLDEIERKAACEGRPTVADESISGEEQEAED